MLDLFFVPQKPATQEIPAESKKLESPELSKPEEKILTAELKKEEEKVEEKPIPTVIHEEKKAEPVVEKPTEQKEVSQKEITPQLPQPLPKEEVKNAPTEAASTIPKVEPVQVAPKPTTEQAHIPAEVANTINAAQPIAVATEVPSEKKVEEQKAIPEPEPLPKNPEEEDDNVLVESPSEEKKDIEAPKVRFALLEKLFSLLNCAEINPVLAGYFAKAMQVLLDKRKLDIMQYIFLYKEHIINILKHSYNKSIAETLNKILSNEDRYMTGTSGEEFINEKQEILKLMIEKMRPNNSIEDITNNCFILCILVDTKQQLPFFMKEETLKEVFKIATSQHPMSLRAGLTYLTTLNRLKNAAGPPQPASQQFNFLGMNPAPRI